MSLLRTAALCACVAFAHAEAPKTEQILQEELVVVATRLPAPADRLASTPTIFDQPTIQATGASYAADVLRHVPGVTIHRLGGYGGLTQVRLRGAEANHSVVLIDGVDASAAGTGEFDLSALLVDGIERIEVLRGPQSGLYGSNALAGVISIHTQTPEPGFAMDADLEAGAHDSRFGRLRLAGGSEHLRGQIAFTTRQSEFDLSDDDSLIGSEEDDNDNRTLSARVTWQPNDRFRMTAFGRSIDKETDTDGFDFSGGPQQGLPIDDLSQSHTEDEFYGVQASWAATEMMTFRVAADQASTELDGGSFGNESERRTVRADAQLAWTDAQATTVFAEQEEETFKNLYPFDPSQVPTQDREITSFGLEHQMSLGDVLNLSASLRRDSNDDFDDSTTYAVSAAWFASDRTSLHASFGSGVTNPTFFEQFGFVPGFFVGNPSLKPEESQGWDVGVKHTVNETLSVGLTYFDADLEDEIQSVFPSVVNGAGTSERSGVEATLSWQPNEQASVQASYTYTDSEQPVGKEVRRPKHTASIIALYDLGRWQLSGSVLRNGQQYDTDFRRFFTNGFVSEDTELDAYTLFNVRVSVDITEGLSAYVRAENLFDEDYEEAIGYSTPGRGFFVGVRYALR